MNYFLDFSTIYQFYGSNNANEKQASTSVKSEEEEKIRPKQREENNEISESMENKKTSWLLDWQFWKRGDNNNGPFSAFRRNNKATGAFTFRKDINEAINGKESGKGEGSSSVAVNIGAGSQDGQSNASGSTATNSKVVGNRKTCASDRGKNVSMATGNRCQPNKPKDVVIDMEKVEGMRNRKSEIQREMPRGALDEKFSPTGEVTQAQTMKPGTKGSAPPTQPANSPQTQKTDATSSKTKKNTFCQAPTTKPVQKRPGNGQNRPTSSVPRQENTPKMTTESKAVPTPKSAEKIRRENKKGHKRFEVKKDKKLEAKKIVGKKNAENPKLGKSTPLRHNCARIEEKPSVSPVSNDKAIPKAKNAGSKTTTAPSDASAEKTGKVEQGRLHHVLKKTPGTPAGNSDALKSQPPRSQPLNAQVQKQSAPSSGLKNVPKPQMPNPQFSRQQNPCPQEPRSVGPSPQCPKPHTPGQQNPRACQQVQKVQMPAPQGNPWPPSPNQRAQCPQAARPQTNGVQPSAKPPNPHPQVQATQQGAKSQTPHQNTLNQAQRGATVRKPYAEVVEAQPPRPQVPNSNPQGAKLQQPLNPQTGNTQRPRPEGIGHQPSITQVAPPTRKNPQTRQKFALPGRRRAPGIAKPIAKPVEPENDGAIRQEPKEVENSPKRKIVVARDGRFVAIEPNIPVTLPGGTVNPQGGKNAPKPPDAAEKKGVVQSPAKDLPKAKPELPAQQAAPAKQIKPIMKDASTSTPTPSTQADVAVQVPDAELEDAGDDIESLLIRLPWDRERVMKMQVLLDEKLVVIGRMREMLRKQRDELKTTKKRCGELETVIKASNMQGKPQLVTQVNELTDIKNELVEEVTNLTVELERERTNVKGLKTELMDVKTQLTAARKKAANLTGQ